LESTEESKDKEKKREKEGYITRYSTADSDPSKCEPRVRRRRGKGKRKKKGGSTTYHIYHSTLFGGVSIGMSPTWVQQNEKGVGGKKKKKGKKGEGSSLSFL